MNFELFYEPRNEMANLLGNEFVCEMTNGENAFLCGLIKQRRPKKIVEVGVAEGGTTAVLMKCIDMLGMDSTEFYSIDYCTNYYRDNSKKTGYIALDNKDAMFNRVNWKLYSGSISVDFIEEIGDDIDFLILDTVHSLPGELLDFPAFLPYLTKNAIVVLHDTFLQVMPNSSRAYATGFLYNVVTGKKIRNFVEDSERYLGLSNISAIEVNEDTRKYCDDVFSGFMITWEYLPPLNELQKYRKWYSRYYKEEFIKLFDLAVLGQETIRLNNWHGAKLCEIRQIFEENERVYLFGYGSWGLHIWNLASALGYSIAGFVISDDADMPHDNITKLPVLRISEISQIKDMCTIIVTVGSSSRKNVIMKLIDEGFNKVY